MRKSFSFLFYLLPKVIAALFILFLPLCAGNFCCEPLSWAIYGITVIYFFIFLFHACWEWKRFFPSAKMSSKLLLAAFLFGATVLSTAISNYATLFTFASFLGFAGIYFSRWKKGVEEPVSKIRLQSMAFRSNWVVDLFFIVLQLAEVFFLALAPGVSRTVWSFSLCLLAGASLLYLVVSRKGRNGVLGARLRVIWLSISLFVMLIPAVLSCFGDSMPVEFRYFLIPLSAIPPLVALLFIDLISGKCPRTERLRSKMDGWKKFFDPLGWLWRRLSLGLGVLFLLVGSVGYSVFHNADLALPYIAPFLYVFSAVFLLVTLPIILFYPKIVSGNPMRSLVLVFGTFLFLLSFALIAAFSVAENESDWMLVKEEVLAFAMGIFPIASLVFVLDVFLFDARLIDSSSAGRGSNIYIFVGTLAFLALWDLGTHALSSGTPPSRITLVFLSALAYFASQGDLAWKERLFIPRAICCVLFALSQVPFFLDIDPLIRLTFMMPPIIIWFVSTGPFIIYRNFPTALGFIRTSA